MLHNEAGLSQTMQILQEEGLTEVIEEWFHQNVQHHLRCTVAPRFWLHYTEPVTNEDVMHHTEKVVNELYQELSAYDSCIRRLALMQGYIADSSHDSRESILKKQQKALDSLKTLLQGHHISQGEQTFPKCSGSVLPQGIQSI